jgi:hypothetical protein
MVGREKFAIYSGSSWILLSRGWFTHRGGRILMRHRSPTIVRAIARIRFPPNENYNSISPAALIRDFPFNLSSWHPSAP